MRCGLQILRSCGLAAADFKNYEVADLRLRIQESRKVVADLQLRNKLLNVQLRTCGCGLRKLKFGCGFADCGLKKKLAVPSTGYFVVLDKIGQEPTKTVKAFAINSYFSTLFCHTWLMLFTTSFYRRLN